MRRVIALLAGGPRACALWCLLLVTGAAVADAQRVSPPARAKRPAGAALTTPSPPLGAADQALLLRLVLAEDRRALGAGDEALLVESLGHRHPTVRLTAVRALGRLQRPSLVDAIEPVLRDPNVAVRAEAVNAVGQALQGFRSRAADDTGRRGAVDHGAEMLVRSAEVSPEPQMLGVAARTLGRLPYADSALVREVERLIVEMGQRPAAVGRTLVWSDASAAQGILHGLYALVRSRRETGMPSATAVQLLRAATTFGLDATSRITGGTPEANARVRRLAYLSLAALRDSSREV
ncbi:MAG: HEAT repeat domain-containing protein, partial [Gemmatimonadaceae bacterium]